MYMDDLIQKEIEEFRKKFTDRWNDGIAVVYPIKEGVAEIIPAEDLEEWLSNSLQKIRDEAKREAISEIEKLNENDWNDCDCNFHHNFNAYLNSLKEGE